jgi:hypothetical protein
MGPNFVYFSLCKHPRSFEVECLFAFEHLRIWGRFTKDMAENERG